VSKQREGKYKTGLTGRIYDRFPGRCIVVRLDAALLQGIPDMGVLFEGGFWCLLEAKSSADADRQPNQEFYVQKLNDMCFSAFIYPENEEAVLNELQEEFETYWAARAS
jgi:hypothetical protein